MMSSLNSEEKFENYLKKYQLADGKRIKSSVMTREVGEKIVEVLKSGGENVDRKFKFFVKKNRFQIFQYEALGLRDILIAPCKNAVIDGVSKGIPDGFARVAYVEDFHKIIEEIHCKTLIHSGVKKTQAKISSLYWGIPRCVVEEFIRLCATCHLKQHQITSPPLQPIISNGFMKRLQVIESVD
ncbi:uncharacterized protein LOC130656017 [Hydractinia symbiolongicarpus]|uniref:uncharacterized protein LOC130622090 n=1 Tax=Hydractinia symbiolongicarpus TaxID=13093 RepID=UPI0025518A6F|nr:uncharacterized protein LOC130622090 [Hydractinia symbiolongicarpus]XP_057314838.1 uncharacterized protein LOC130656017 [Hydractinia symbiolongicarpus]